MARGAKHPIDREMRWNFGDSRGTSLSLDEFLAQKEAAGVEFFAGKEPWLVGLHKLSWQTFFRVCTQEMDDLSQKAIKLVIEYCLEVLEEVEKTIRGKASLARLEAALCRVLERVSSDQPKVPQPGIAERRRSSPNTAADVILTPAAPTGIGFSPK